MKAQKIASASASISIMCVLFASVPWVSGQTPAGSAFTYQGQLRKDGLEVTGACSFEFSLWDSEIIGTQLGSTLEFSSINLTNGRFTVELDFGDDYFDGSARWLEVVVSCADDDVVVTLPRQKVTPTPYALFALKPWETDLTDGSITYNQGNVGIGTASPQAALDVGGDLRVGGFRVTDTGGGYMHVLTGYNGSLFGCGNAINGIGYNIRYAFNGGSPQYEKFAPDPSIWMEFPTSYVRVMSNSDTTPGTMAATELLRVTNSGNVGIGISNPASKLHIDTGIDGTPSTMTLQDGANRTTVVRSPGIGNAQVGTTTGHSLELITSNTPRVFIHESTGNVGIGTITPGSVLGATTLQIGKSTTGASLRLEGGTVRGFEIHSGAAGNALEIFPTDNPSNDHRVVVNSDGNVGIGTPTPQGKFHVLGNLAIIESQDSPVGRLNLRGVGPAARQWGLGQPGVASDGSFSIGDGSAGLDRLFIDTVGRIGIGNTNPLQRLSVSGGMDIDHDGQNIGGVGNSLRFGHSGSGEAIGSKRSPGGNQFGLDFYTDSVPRMAISQSGNVGIGTSNPPFRLSVENNEPDLRISLNNTGSGGRNWNLITSSVGSGLPSGSLTIWDQTAQLARVTITSSGDVGIGTALPTSKLQVTGEVASLGLNIPSGTVALPNNQIDSGEVSFNYAGSLSKGGPSSDVVCSNCITLGSETAGAYDATPDTIADDGLISDGEVSDAITINNGLLYAPTSGNVGIGTTSPEVPLQILGGSALTLSGGGHLQIGPTNNNNMIIDHNDIQRRQNGAPAELILNRYGGRVGIGLDAPAALLHVDGNARVDGNITVQSCTGCSDRRFKSDVSPLSGGLATLAKLQGVRFRWRQREFPDRNFVDGPQLGFIAQDVQQVLPEVVSKDESGFLSVDYGRVTALLVEGIKEQQAMLEEARQKNEELAERLSQLEGTVVRPSQRSDGGR